jgi:hypothetical protein
MASKAHGLPLSIVQLHFQLLTEMFYSIEIAQYSSQPHSPVFGTGQGSGSSHTIWIFISNVLIKSFENQAKGATYPCGYSEDITVKSSAYVDDVNTHHTDADIASLDKSMVHDYSTWKGILHSSGGLLAQAKCNHYKISWDFKATGQPVLSEAKEGKIDNLVASSPRYGVHKSLGYMMSPTQRSEHQVDYWKKQENKFLQMLMSSEMSYYEVQVLYKKDYIDNANFASCMVDRYFSC